ncbi:MAG: AarF/ABC1/UbiB kinase family protein [Polyangiaceae bacterium]|nr:AarF/ABC1/UbiB kinase family protein [Polyangiaceae bacterium]
MVRIVHAARDIARVRDISTVLIRHGFGEVVARLGIRRGRSAGEGRRRESVVPESTRSGGSEPPDSADLASDATPEDIAHGDAALRELSVPVRVRRVLEDLGPSFIKLGQIVSTRADVVPPDVIAELRKLQDSVPPIPFAELRAALEQSLGRALGEVFESFEETPLAAGSIAQVHRARVRADHGSHDVVVKVQRPGIARTIASDVDLLHTLAGWIERAIPESRVYSPVGLVQQFDHAITNELNFSLEAENSSIFTQNFEQMPQVKFPRVYREASTKQVLTLEYLDGRKVYDAIEAGFVGRKLSQIALQVMVKQIFEDGFFHADPHPGNVIILGTPEHPVLGLIDLGMVGRLSPRVRDLTIDLMVSALRKDYDGIADAIYSIGNPTEKFDREAFRSEVGLRAERYLGRPLKEVQLSGLVRDVVQGATQFGLKIPTDFTLVGKALMTVEGVGRELDPDIDLFTEARPLFLNLLKKRYSPERLGMELLRRVERLSDASDTLPQQIHEVLEDLRFGRLTVNAADPGIVRAADLLGKRMFVGLMNGSMLVSGTLLISTRYWIVGGLFLLSSIVWLATFALMELYRAIRGAATRRRRR